MNNLKVIYMLTHSRSVEEDVHDTKLIGFYSSRQNAEKVIKRYKSITGFCDYPEDFVIEEWEANVDDFNDICGDFKYTVFYLAHEYYDGVEYDYVTDIGVYSTLKKAERAMSKYRKLPQFKEYTDGFSIDEYEIDKDHWTEGFDTYI